MGTFQKVTMRNVSSSYNVGDHPDGSIEWLPDEPAQNGLDQKKFERELELAKKVSEAEGKEVWWVHNGVKVSSEIARHPEPWAWLTEQNSVMAN